MKLRIQRKSSLTLTACGALFLSPELAHSAITISLTPTPTGAVVTVRGSLNLANTVVSESRVLENVVVVSGSTAFVGGNGSMSDLFAGLASGDDFIDAKVGLGSYIGDDALLDGFGVLGPNVVVPSNYTGKALDLSGEFTGNIFQNTGGSLEENKSRTVTLMNGDFVTFQTSPDTVPEPSATVLIGLAGLGLLYRSRR